MWRLILALGASALVATASLAATRPTPPGTAAWGTSDTAHTTRIAGATPEAQAVALTQVLYPSTNHQNRPHAVIITRSDQEAIAMLAVSRLTHFPTNAPLLFADKDQVPAVTLDEIKRLEPDGSAYDANVQVYLVGEFAPRVESQLREVVKPHDALTGGIRKFPTSDPIQLADDLDVWASRVHGTPAQATVILQLRDLASGLPSVYWNAHMGHAVAFVDGDRIPEATRRILARRWDHTAFMYLMGGTALIPASVQAQLEPYGLVRRVAGNDAVEVATTFAGYRDAGRTTRFGLGTEPRDFGWGIAASGHNFAFVDPRDWHAAVTGALLSHMGKHGPLLLVARDKLPTTVSRYLQMVQPEVTAPSGQLVNHGWVLGTLSVPVQRAIDGDLAPKAPTQASR